LQTAWEHRLTPVSRDGEQKDDKNQAKEQMEQVEKKAGKGVKAERSVGEAEGERSAEEDQTRQELSLCGASHAPFDGVAAVPTGSVARSAKLPTSV